MRNSPILLVKIFRGSKSDKNTVFSNLFKLLAVRMARNLAIKNVWSLLAGLRKYIGNYFFLLCR